MDQDGERWATSGKTVDPTTGQGLAARVIVHSTNRATSSCNPRLCQPASRLLGSSRAAGCPELVHAAQTSAWPRLAGAECLGVSPSRPASGAVGCTQETAALLLGYAGGRDGL